MPGCVIGDRAVIGASAVVLKDSVVLGPGCLVWDSGGINPREGAAGQAAARRFGW